MLEMGDVERDTEAHAYFRPLAPAKTDMEVDISPVDCYRFEFLGMQFGRCSSDVLKNQIHKMYISTMKMEGMHYGAWVVKLSIERGEYFR